MGNASLWLRRLRDGRCLVLGFTDTHSLPDGVNDAVVAGDVIVDAIRDETENGKGKTYLDIIETGWKPIMTTSGMNFRDALEAVGG